MPVVRSYLAVQRLKIIANLTNKHIRLQNQEALEEDILRTSKVAVDTFMQRMACHLLAITFARVCSPVKYWNTDSQIRLMIWKIVLLYKYRGLPPKWIAHAEWNSCWRDDTAPISILPSLSTSTFTYYCPHAPHRKRPGQKRKISRARYSLKWMSINR